MSLKYHKAHMTLAAEWVGVIMLEWRKNLRHVSYSIFTTSRITSSSSRNPKETQHSRLPLFSGCKNITLKAARFTIPTKESNVFSLYCTKTWHVIDPTWHIMLFLVDANYHFGGANSNGRIHMQKHLQTQQKTLILDIATGRGITLRSSWCKALNQ